MIADNHSLNLHRSFRSNLKLNGVFSFTKRTGAMSITKTVIMFVTYAVVLARMNGYFCAFEEIAYFCKVAVTIDRYTYIDSIRVRYEV